MESKTSKRPATRRGLDDQQRRLLRTLARHAEVRGSRNLARLATGRALDQCDRELRHQLGTAIEELRARRLIEAIGQIQPGQRRIQRTYRITRHGRKALAPAPRPLAVPAAVSASIVLANCAMFDPIPGEPAPVVIMDPVMSADAQRIIDQLRNLPPSQPAAPAPGATTPPAGQASAPKPAPEPPKPAASQPTTPGATAVLGAKEESRSMSKAPERTQMVAATTYFRGASAQVRGVDRPFLRSISQYIGPNSTITVTGSTDASGSAKANKALALARAAAVRDELRKAGIKVPITVVADPFVVSLPDGYSAGKEFWDPSARRADIVVEMPKLSRQDRNNENKVIALHGPSRELIWSSDR